MMVSTIMLDESVISIPVVCIRGQSLVSFLWDEGNVSLLLEMLIAAPTIKASP
jgi:hypothetical protein